MGEGVDVTPRGQTDAMAPSVQRGADPARFVFGPERTWDGEPQLAAGWPSCAAVLDLDALSAAIVEGDLRSDTHRRRGRALPDRHAHSP